MQNLYGVLDNAENRNDFTAIKLTLAPPEKIRSWSYGEVRMPETINYRTFRPETGGLFCAKIFGPTKDYECLCGKYKRMKYRGVVCEKCGVEVTLARVRRERMGHITLACPVAHILFFKALPSRIGLILDLTMRDIERILYFEVYVVIDPERAPDLERGQLLNIEQYQKHAQQYSFRAGIGAEGVRDFLKEIDLKSESKLLREELARAGSDTRRKKIFKRLKIIESFQRAGLRPEWMVLEALPVLPPDLRPLVQLEGGRFTTSDLNDLYRRVINRNNRLKRLIELGAPDVIINNEKRMLQESVDSLLDNGRRGKPAVGVNRRPLKSVVDIIKGKSGRFRQNLLGKRVDFSGRSVVVVGPDLKLHQCGLPKQMALTLFRPFVFNKLIEHGYASSVKHARTMVESSDPQVWAVLEEVIAQHPVLLNRAPTLHRLGVQAFEPILIEGKAIQLHPLVCVAFNADFDGDQMAVHVPLSLEAQAEARVLMLSSNNVLAPANGEPIIVPTQDVVLGLYYATREDSEALGAGMRFSDVAEVERAFAAAAVAMQAPIEVRIEDEPGEVAAGESPPLRQVKTTVGRALLKRFLPARLPFSEINRTLKKRDITSMIKECFRLCGQRDTVIFCDQLMRFGFERATRAGISVCMDDMIIPDEKKAIIEETEDKIREAHQQFQNGLLTEDERYNKSVDLWDKAGERVSQVMMKSISSRPVLDAQGNPVKDADGGWEERESFNSIYMMADSGARGSETQIKQLAGMRGLMTKPDGRIMENAITANFREGLSVLQYFISTHGARKGLSDTALKTANSGYLTRRLVDVTQDIVVSEMDCGSADGIVLHPLLKDGEMVVTLDERIVGRTLAAAVVHPQSRKVVYEAGTYVQEQEARAIVDAGIDEVKVRSPVTCKTRYGLCTKCYGRDLGRGGLVCLGEAVGVVAAQSIGEPGTQLTMRTFHIGGAASREVVSRTVEARNNGVLRFNATRYVSNADGDLVVVSRGGEMSVQEKNGRERERYRLQYGQVLKAKNGDAVKAGQILSHRDPMTRPIIAEYEGTARLENIEMGVNAREQTDDIGLSTVTIIENKQGTKKAKQSQMKFLDPNGEEVKILGTTAPVTIVLLPGATLSVRDGQKIGIGDIIAKMPQKAAKSRDITGGLPRVAELFEAREPKEPAILASVAGRVSLRGVQRGKQVLAIVEDDKKESHRTAAGYSMLVKNDSEIKKGDIIAEQRDGEETNKVVAGLSGLVYIRDDRPDAEVGAAEDVRRQVLSLCRPGKKIPGHLKTWAAELAAQLKNFSGSDKETRSMTVATEKALRAAAQYSGRGVSGEQLGKWYRAFVQRARADKLPAHLAQWGHDTTAQLADKSDRSYKKLHAVVVAAEKSLAPLAAEKSPTPLAADKGVLKLLDSWREKESVIANPPKGTTVTQKKIGEWYRAFAQRAHPDKLQKLAANVQQWGHEVTTQLLEDKKSESGLTHEKLLAAVATAGKSLAQLAAEKSPAPLAADKGVLKLLDSWREKMRTVVDEAEAAIAQQSEADIKAEELELNLLSQMRAIVVQAKAAKTVRSEKIVEIVSAHFHAVPKGRTILTQDGSLVSRGEEIVDGESNPHEILARRGVEELVQHIVNEVQDVYRLQGVNINDKHIEVIIHQMMRCVCITNPGDSHLIPGDQIMRSELMTINTELEEEGKKPAKAKRLLLGITKASLATDSFISAASFQETSRVLTEAAVAGRRDVLRGLKENVIVGRLVPAGTGYVHYQKIRERNAQAEAEYLLQQELEVVGDAAAVTEDDKESSDKSPPAAG